MRILLPFLIMGMFLTGAQAASLKEFLKQDHPKGLRVLIFNGTFDPPHWRHLEIVEQALETGDYDYAVIMINDLAIHKVMATPVEDRLNMTKLMVQNHPRILVPDDYKSFGFPHVQSLPKTLKRKLKKPVLTGLLGYDSVIRATVRMTSNALKVDNWLVTHSIDESLDEVPNEMFGRSVSTLLAPASDRTDDIHSSAIRKFFLRNIDNPEIPNGEGLKLDQDVVAYIKKQKLYGKAETAANKRKAVPSVCARIFKQLGNRFMAKFR